MLIPAAGVGQRAGREIPKQFVTLAGRPLIEWVLRRYDRCPLISHILVCADSNASYWNSLDLSDLTTPVDTVTGGATRAHSVLNGLRWLSGQIDDEDYVLVHDAVRPCVSDIEINALINACRHHEVGGLLGLPVVDTLKSVGQEHCVEKTLQRDLLWRALTPQMFKHNVLLRALEQSLAAGMEVTDESSAIESLGLKPLIVKGSAYNIKVTYPEDFMLAEFLLQRLGDI